MKIVLLHTHDAAESPVDPVLAQLSDALTRSGHVVVPLEVNDAVEQVVRELRQAQPDLVFNLAA